MATKDRINAPTIVGEVTERMRRMLYAGEFVAGERLRLKDLQERFGVSHIPIREALRTLEAEGLVENVPQKGAVAGAVSLETLGQVYDARRLLEPPIAARAASQISQSDIDELSEAYQGLAAATVTDDDFFAAHREFHWLTLRPGATPIIEGILRKLWGISERFLRLSLAFPSDVSPAIGQHETIYQMMIEGEAGVAEVVNQHLHVTEDAILNHYATAANAEKETAS